MKQANSPNHSKAKFTWFALLVLLQRSPALPHAKHLAGLLGRVVGKTWAWRVAVPTMVGAGSYHSLSAATTFVNSTDPNPASGTEGDSYEFAFFGDGNHFVNSYKVENLPAGLSFNGDIFSPKIEGTLLAEGSYSISITGYRFSNFGGNATPTYTLTLNVAGGATNAAPVLSSIADQTTAEDTVATVTATATDADGDNLTYSATSSDANVTVVATGSTLTLTPAADFTGTATITVTANDGNGGTATQTFDLEVTAVNDAPVLATIADQTTAEDTVATVTATATDADGDNLTYSATSSDANVTVATTGSTLTLTPAADFTGTATITVTANDGNGGTATQTFDLEVTAVNDAPEIDPIADLVTPEDTPKTITLSAMDLEGDTLSFSASSNNAGVSVTTDGTSLTMVPSNNFNGTVTITVSVNDGNGGTDSTTFELEVSSVVDPPLLDPIADLSTPEDTPKVITVSASDPDNPEVTFSVASDNPDIAVSVSGNQVTIAPTTNYVGNATITVTALDGDGGSDSTTFKLEVSPVNDPPVLGGIGTQTTAEDTPTTFSLSASDPENDSINFTAIYDTTQVSVSFEGNEMTLEPAQDWNGETTILLSANDGNGGIHTQGFVFEVTPRNDPPTLSPIGSQTIDEDTTGSVEFSVTDPDADTITYTATSSSDNVSLFLEGNSLTFQPDPDWFGSTSITVSADDGNGGSAFTAFLLTVNPLDDGPVLLAWDTTSATDIGGNWKDSDWFGIFYENGDGWAYHLEMGWLFVTGESESSLWIHHPEYGWLFTSASQFPFLYRESSGTWLYFRTENGVPTFYEFSGNQWLQLD